MWYSLVVSVLWSVTLIIANERLGCIWKWRKRRT